MVRTFRETIGTGVKVGAAQAARISLWICSASLFAAGTQEVMEVGPHFQAATPSYNNRLLFEVSNVSGGALAGALVSIGRDPATALLSRQGRVLSRPQLRLAYVVLGGIGGMYLPRVLGHLSSLAPRRQSGGAGSPQ